MPFFVHGPEERLSAVAREWTLDGQVARNECVQETKFVLHAIDTMLSVILKFLEQRCTLPTGLHSHVREEKRVARLRQLYPGENADFYRNKAVETDGWMKAWKAVVKQRHPKTFMLAKFLLKLRNTLTTELSALKLRVRRDILDQAKAVLCTVDTAGTLTRSEDYATLNSRITCVIIDEAGTCNEAKMPLLLCLPHLDRIIVVGDQKQLAPFSHVEDRPSRGRCYDFEKGRCLRGGSCKFSHSEAKISGVFQRLDVALGSGKIPMLMDQYRMHPDIEKFVSAQFYGGRLSTPEDTARERRAAVGPAPAIIWVDSHEYGRDELQGQSKSQTNPGEATLVAALLKDWQTQGKLDGKSVMVITFYKAQVQVLKDKLRAVNLAEKADAAGYDVGHATAAAAAVDPQRKTLRQKWEDTEAARKAKALAKKLDAHAKQDAAIGRHHMGTIKSLRICSVDQAQGSEADIVVLSCVRSNDMGQVGFTTNPNRFNVAVSRARERLVVVGDAKTLTSRGDRYWTALHEAATTTSADSLGAPRWSGNDELDELERPLARLRIDKPRHRLKKVFFLEL